MNAKTQTRVEALKTALQNDVSKKDIVARFTAEWNVSTPTVLRLITTAQQEIKDELDEKKKIINKVRRKKIAESAEEDIITELEADAILCSIILGKRKVKKAFNTVGGLVIEEMGPDHNTILKALDMYYKRMGSYKISKEEEGKEEEEEEITDIVIGCNACTNEAECSEGCRKWAGITDKEIRKQRWSELMPGNGQPESEPDPEPKPTSSIGFDVREETEPVAQNDIAEGYKPETSPSNRDRQESSETSSPQELENKEVMPKPQTSPMQHFYRDSDGKYRLYRGMFAPRSGSGPRVKNYPVK